jgi:hypothetical protein
MPEAGLVGVGSGTLVDSDSWLRARNWVVEDAFKQLDDTLKWRDEVCCWLLVVW